MSAPVHGLLVEFASADALLGAAARVREAGYSKIDAFTAYSVPGLAQALGLPKSRLPWLVFGGALSGGTFGYLMQWYSSTVAYPLNVGGRPLHSWPSFIPVTFELTILGAAFTAVIGMLIAGRLTRLDHPLFSVDAFERASTDRFFICIEASDPAFDSEATRAFLQSLAPEAVHDVAR